MPAHEKVSVQEIVNSLLRWRGNLQAVASDLGLNRGALYERIQRVGIDLAGFRVAGKPVTPITGASGMPGFREGVQLARKTVAPGFPAAAKSPNFRNVQTETSEDAAPIQSIRMRPKPVRLQPPLQDELREAKLDLGARFRIETDETAILNQFFREAFQGWLASKLGSAEAKPQPKRGRKGETGDPA